MRGSRVMIRRIVGIAMIAVRMIFSGKSGGKLIIGLSGVDAVRQTAAKKR